MGDLNDEVAYVGGATVGIYADDPIAEDVRPTKDVDIMLHIATFAELAVLQNKLASKNIYPDPEANINCRFKYEDVLIDVMSTKEVGCTDFEDIVYVLDSRLNIVNEIRNAPSNVRDYLKEQLKHFLSDDMSESISCHLSPFQSGERLALLREKVKSILYMESC